MCLNIEEKYVIIYNLVRKLLIEEVVMKNMYFANKQFKYNANEHSI